MKVLDSCWRPMIPMRIADDPLASTPSLRQRPLPFSRAGGRGMLSPSGNRMPFDLKDRFCLTPGAARAIGRATAEGFARRGAIVVATSLERPACAGAAANLVWDVT